MPSRFANVAGAERLRTYGGYAWFHGCAAKQGDGVGEPARLVGLGGAGGPARRRWRLGRRRSAQAPDPALSVRAVRAYRFLPEAAVPPVGYGLPVLEVAVGLLLIVGLGTRVVAALSAVLFLAFVVGIASAWARGLQIDCGCFGGGGFRADATAQYPWEIARDIGLLALSVALVVRPRTALSLDDRLLPRGEV
jgi:uncharacterized membrane protein YphA (DoxX/SURF4 family)